MQNTIIASIFMATVAFYSTVSTQTPDITYCDTNKCPCTPDIECPFDIQTCVGGRCAVKNDTASNCQELAWKGMCTSSGVYRQKICDECSSTCRLDCQHYLTVPSDKCADLVDNCATFGHLCQHPLYMPLLFSKCCATCNFE
uniref:ShKT domain-containing protein n=1 Tax=Rhabditophanes sp. KR3021 TaxID=114890 RepID=A0AC35UFK6_9BILA